jgi:hypothetical protein
MRKTVNMRKKVKIRFVEGGPGSYKGHMFSVQEKRWYGWKWIGYYTDTICGDIYEYYNADTKENLLEKVIDNYYKTTKKHLTIIEYPTIKWY